MKSNVTILIAGLWWAVANAQSLTDTLSSRSATVQYIADTSKSTERVIKSVSEVPVREVGAPQAKSEETILVNDPKVLIKTQGDTLFMIIADKKELFDAVANKIKMARKLGYGGAGGYGVRACAVNMAPVHSLAQILFPSAVFPALSDGYTPMILNGGFGYGGVGNGLRIGGGGWGGRTKYQSQVFRNDTVASVAYLGVNFGYGGFMIEKAFVNGNSNWYAGGILGVGSFSVNPNTRAANQISAFTNLGDLGNANIPTATFSSLELHAGGTYTVLPWMHVGGDASVVCAYSMEGFDGYWSGSFVGFYPSLGIRIVFGNLG